MLDSESRDLKMRILPSLFFEENTSKLLLFSQAVLFSFFSHSFFLSFFLKPGDLIQKSLDLPQS